MAGTASPSAADLPRFFSRYQPRIAAAMRAELATQSLPLYETLRYFMGWTDVQGKPSTNSGGKAFRPTLCLLACEAAGGSPDSALPAAVALEFVHNFSLIHDDIEDQDRYRRHRLTVWAIWGVPKGIVAGNALLKVADRAAMRMVEQGVAVGVAVEAAEALTRGYLKMMEGQHQDMAFESRKSVTVDEYLDMIERKTGALIETAVYLGSLVAHPGEPDRELAEGLRTVGWELGRIFQIRDDILGVWGGPLTGKPVGADIQRKKKALPAVHAIDHAKGAPLAELLSIYSKDEVTPSDIAQVLDIMESLRTQEWCQELATDRWRRALRVIKSLPLAGDTPRQFEELGEFLLARES